MTRNRYSSMKSIGKSNSLYRHDLQLLIQNKISTGLSSSLNKLQLQQKFERLIPKYADNSDLLYYNSNFCRKTGTSIKINNTRGCLRCCVGKNPFGQFMYIAGLTSQEIFLMQYYEPHRKFMHSKVSIILEHSSNLW